MINNEEKLYETLKNLGLPWREFHHEALFTSEQANKVAATLEIPGMGVKNLFLKDRRKDFYLVSAAYITKIDLRDLGTKLGTKDLRFASADNLRDMLGVEPGSVTPLALINDDRKKVRFVMDSALQREEWIQVHPLVNTKTLVLMPRELQEFINFLEIEVIELPFVP